MIASPQNSLTRGPWSWPVIRRGAVVFEGGVLVAGAEVVAVVAQHDAAGAAAGPGVDAQGGSRFAGDGGQRLVQLAQRPGRRRARGAGVLAAYHQRADGHISDILNHPDVTAHFSNWHS